MDAPMEAAITPLVIIHGNKNIHLVGWVQVRTQFHSLNVLQDYVWKNCGLLPLLCAYLLQVV